MKCLRCGKIASRHPMYAPVYVENMSADERNLNLPQLELECSEVDSRTLWEFLDPNSERLSRYSLCTSFKHSNFYVKWPVKSYHFKWQFIWFFSPFRTAAPYFSNLVWFIGKHILELDSCVRNDIEWVKADFFHIIRFLFLSQFVSTFLISIHFSRF